MILQTAIKYIGIKEGDNPIIEHWINKTMGLDPNSGAIDVTTPWCAIFMSQVLIESGIEFKRVAGARKFLEFGKPIELADIELGDVVVLTRGFNPAQGHVGVFVGFHKGDILLLGGNQINKVGINGFEISRVVGVRRFEKVI